MAHLQMELFENARRFYVPPYPPPTWIEPSPGRRSASAGRRGLEVFQPFEEALPLQSGYYSFVIDEFGHFRVQMGNTRSHASLNFWKPACAAGRFRVNRIGQTIHVVCTSTDYRLSYQPELVEYVILAFRSHTAFALNPGAVFQFHRSATEKTYYAADGQTLTDPDERIRLLEAEGLSGPIPFVFSPAQRAEFSTYLPPKPPTLYTMKLDQQILSLEECSDDDESFEFGPPAPPFGLETSDLRAGKNNFVIDDSGRLILGMVGHQILSGGQPVGGAGHANLTLDGRVDQLDLNFSGHYRPDLSCEYVRYVYQIFRDHPLIRLDPRCGFRGRWFGEETQKTRMGVFTLAELESDNDAELEAKVFEICL